MPAIPDYGLFGPGSGSSGYVAGANSRTSSPFDSGYWGSVAGGRYSNTQQDQGNVARIGPDGIAYQGGSTSKFNGKDETTGKYYRDGVELSLVPGSSSDYINPNNPNERYKATSIVKDSEVNSAAAAQLSELEKNMADLSKSLNFDTHLKDFQSDLSSARDKTAVATDIGGTEASLRGSQRDYVGALDRSSADYQALNADNAAKQQALLDRYQETIPLYDTAAQNTADRSQAAMQQQWNKMRLLSGTPMSADSNSQRLLARNTADIQLPTQLAKIKAQQDFYSNLALPVQRDLYGNERTRISQFNPQIAQQEFASGQATEQTIQGLRQQVAQMSTTQAVAFMQSLSVPVALQQQILSGQTQQLGQIAQIRSGANYQGLQDLLGANLTQPQYFSRAQSAYPVYPGAAPQGYGGGGGGGVTGTVTGGNAPVTVNPNGGVTSTGGVSYNPIGSAGYLQTLAQNRNARTYTNPYGTGYDHSYFDDQGLPISASGVD